MYKLSKFALILFLITLFSFSCKDPSSTAPTKTPFQTNKLNLAEKVLPDNLVVTNSISHREVIRKTNVRNFFLWEDDFGTPLNQRDDVGTYIEFGFQFSFYGIVYDGAWVNSNGNLTFNAENRYWSHPDIPDGDNIIIGPLYGDFDPAKGGNIYVNKLGTGNKERFVVTWANVPEYRPADDSNTFQLILFKTRNIIVFGYNGIETDGINWAYSSPSVDGNMDVGISSGLGQFINSASGSEIINLDNSNIV